MTLLRVASNSRTASLAGAIAGVIREQNYVELQAIGAAVNQTIKALVLANGYLMGEGRRIIFRAEFVSVETEPGEPESNLVQR